MVTPVVAADPIGADNGENVVVAFGKAARVACGGDGDYAFEAAIVGIVDDLDVRDAPESWAHETNERGRSLMLIGTVVGHLWATRKDATLEGLRFLVVQPWMRGGQTAETIVAVDPIGADIGERVIVAWGRAARHAIGRGHDVGFQSAIVGVVDGMSLEGGERVGQTAAEDALPTGSEEDA